MDYDRDYFKGKTVIVTGGGSGIGLALIEEMLQSGAAQAVMADINQERLNEHSARLKELYGTDRLKAIRCNVTSEEQVQDLIDQSADFFGGRIDILFNNAGGAFPGWFDDLSTEDWKIAFDLNFYSALYGCRAVLPIMKAQGSGQRRDYLV